MPASNVPPIVPQQETPVVDASLVGARATDFPQPPVRLRELLALIALVVLGDVTVYRGEGYTGVAVLFVLAPVLLLLGKPAGPRHWRGAWLIGFMLIALATRMVWCGNIAHPLIGAVLLLGFGVALTGLTPYLLEIAVFPSRMLFGGARGLIHLGRSIRPPNVNRVRVGWLSIALPLVTLIAFSVLFVLANPDLLDALGSGVEQVLDTIRAWVLDRLPPFSELLFWLGAGWIAMGMLRPYVLRPLFENNDASSVKPVGRPATPAPLYAACRNTLAAVIILFAVYLIFEFKTLWLRVFPAGFYYSGYAHQGAAWLTVALALATVVLSLVFQGQMLLDPRIRKLRRLAWIWSIENLLLAIAVYHRLYIYIGFNGMTRMRIVGFFGMSAVVVGFLLVVWKIAHNRSFLWLMHRHAWTVALTIYLLALTPADVLVVSYNVRRIMAGDPAPSVQISVHPISAEGIVLLEPLLQCDDKLIREGVRAMLAARYEQSEQLAQDREAAGWTAFQWSDQLVLETLKADKNQWTPYRDAGRREQVLERFHRYAYQWY